MSREPMPSIGKHLAVLNLFRERDGSVQITVASATGAVAEHARRTDRPEDEKPVDYVDDLILLASVEILKRRQARLKQPEKEPA